MTTVTEPTVEQYVDFATNGRYLVTRWVTECGCRVEKRELFSKNDLYARCYGGNPEPVETEIVVSCPHEKEWYL